MDSTNTPRIPEQTLASDSSTTTHDVSVVGCGAMGSALARTFAGRGLSVAVWNRTPGRAEALAGEDISAITEIDVAVGSAPLVVACTSTYAAARASLDRVTDWTGTTLANIGSGTPDEAKEMQRWVSERGGTYLDGSILCYPQDIGTPRGHVLFAGAGAQWTEHAHVFAALGAAAQHVSESVHVGSVLEVAIAGGFYLPALSAFVESATYTRSQGVSSAELRGLIPVALDLLRAHIDETATAIEIGNHVTEQASLSVYAEGARTALAAMRSAGQRARLLNAAAENLATAEAAGLGSFGFSVQTEIASAE
ncbi:NAD(P)-binding domain-containing protein [Nocardia asteroides]|uniref:NAD(P)-binding domain-containing protein n=1 Tax=Nocardia asteroides TaxID=1824 RepID=UPI0037C7CA75